MEKDASLNGVMLVELVNVYFLDNILDRNDFDPTSFSRLSPGSRRGPVCTWEPSPTSALDEKSNFSRPIASAQGLEKTDFSLNVDVGEGSHVHAGPLRGPGESPEKDAGSKSFLSSSLAFLSRAVRCQ